MMRDRDPVYRPSETVTWLQCPVKWRLQRSGWISRVVAYRDTAAWVGTAIHAGLAQYRRAGAQTMDVVAHKSLRQSFARAIEQGRHVDTDFDALAKLVETACAKYPAKDPLKDWITVAVEQVMPDHGGCTPDYVGRTIPEGRLVPVDYKVVMRAPKAGSPIAAMQQQRYAESWQMQHYLWAVSDHWQEPVTDYVIVQLTLQPTFQVELFTYPISPERLARWLKRAQQVWQRMAEHEAMSNTEWQAAVHTDQFGVCEYFDHSECFGHDEDNELYVKEMR